MNMTVPWDQQPVLHDCETPVVLEDCQGPRILLQMPVLDHPLPVYSSALPIEFKHQMEDPYSQSQPLPLEQVWPKPVSELKPAKLVLEIVSIKYNDVPVDFSVSTTGSVIGERSLLEEVAPTLTLTLTPSSSFKQFSNP